MLRRAFLFCSLLAVLVLPAQRVFAAEASEPTAVANDLYDALLASMKKGSELDFAARRAMLAPVIKRDFDLEFMTRLIVGAPWRNMSEDERQKLVEAFSDYTTSTYAQRFKAYDGERFEVEPKVSPMNSGDNVVHTKLVTGGGKVVQLDYLMRKNAKSGQWRIIDIFLSGTISEAAARRSEYSATIRQGGASALTALLNKKVAELAGGAAAAE
ncbi:MAG TPA: ABC transporter substrate-binding protein [Opitutaceae bacterium]|nr:ABC transporter substrate-binding protein [Opitutaceae bacterium]